MLRNKDLRAGLSHAINRQGFIDLVFIGQAQPLQTAVLPSYELLHDDKLATQYLDYDVAKANEYLDKAFPEKDDDGFRQGPDGNRIQFALLTRADKALVAYVGQMLVGYWRDVGVDTRFDVVDRSLARFHKNANQHSAIIEYFPGGARDAFLRPTPWGPMHHNAVYGIPWFDCYRAEGGEEPPENIMRQIERWNMINATADQEARVEMMRQILANAAEDFYNIGNAVPVSSYAFTNARMHNVPESMQGSYWFAPTGPLKSRDMYAAGSFILIQSVLTVVGTLTSHLLLAWLDPRMSHE